MLILDTDVLSILQHGMGPEHNRLQARLRATSHQPVFVTIVSFEEQAKGWLAYTAKARTKEQLLTAYFQMHRFLRQFRHQQVLDFDEPAVDRFQELVKQRRRIGTMDLKIAAIALVHGATLISRNLKDFRKVPGLVVEDWTVP